MVKYLIKRLPNYRSRLPAPHLENRKTASADACCSRSQKSLSIETSSTQSFRLHPIQHAFCLLMEY